MLTFREQTQASCRHNKLRKSIILLNGGQMTGQKLDVPLSPPQVASLAFTAREATGDDFLNAHHGVVRPPACQRTGRRRLLRQPRLSPAAVERHTLRAGAHLHRRALHAPTPPPRPKSTPALGLKAASASTTPSLPPSSGTRYEPRRHSYAETQAADGRAPCVAISPSGRGPSALSASASTTAPPSGPARGRPRRSRWPCFGQTSIGAHHSAAHLSKHPLLEQQQPKQQQR